MASAGSRAGARPVLGKPVLSVLGALHFVKSVSPDFDILRVPCPASVLAAFKLDLKTFYANLGKALETLHASAHLSAETMNAVVAAFKTSHGIGPVFSDYSFVDVVHMKVAMILAAEPRGAVDFRRDPRTCQYDYNEPAARYNGRAAGTVEARARDDVQAILSATRGLFSTNVSAHFTKVGSMFDALMALRARGSQAKLGESLEPVNLTGANTAFHQAPDSDVFSLKATPARYAELFYALYDPHGVDSDLHVNAQNCFLLRRLAPPAGSSTMTIGRLMIAVAKAAMSDSPYATATLEPYAEPDASSDIYALVRQMEVVDDSFARLFSPKTSNARASKPVPSAAITRDPVDKGDETETDFETPALRPVIRAREDSSSESDDDYKASDEPARPAGGRVDAGDETQSESDLSDGDTMRKPLRPPFVAGPTMNDDDEATESDQD